MSYHCWLCGHSEHWMRGKERKNCGMVIIRIFDCFAKNGGRSRKQLDCGIVHADCLSRALGEYARKHACEYSYDEFDFLKERAENGDFSAKEGA